MIKKKKNRGISPVWILAPSLVAITICFVAPLLLLLRMSFNVTGQYMVLIHTVSFKTYIEAVLDPYYWVLLFNTLKLGLTVSVITTVLSYPIALFLTKTRSKWRGILFALAIGPLLTSQIARTFGWMALLGNNGLVNGLLIYIGLIDSPLMLSNNYIGVVIALVEILMPYALLGMISGFGRVSTELEHAAGILGASIFKQFTRITLPLSLPGVFTGFLLVLVLTISSFVTPYLVGGGRVNVLATAIYEKATITLDWPLAAALSMMLFVLFGIIISIYLKVTKIKV